MNKYHRSAILSIILSLSAMITTVSPIRAQSEPVIFNNLKYANKVELKSGQGSLFLSQNEATRTIKKLIDKIDPINISSIHEGYSQDKTSFYGIIKLESESGNHRLFYYCEKIGNEYLITKIRVNKR